MQLYLPQGAENSRGFIEDLDSDPETPPLLQDTDSSDDSDMPLIVQDLSTSDSNSDSDSDSETPPLLQDTDSSDDPDMPLIVQDSSDSDSDSEAPELVHVPNIPFQIHVEEANSYNPAERVSVRRFGSESIGMSTTTDFERSIFRMPTNLSYYENIPITASTTTHHQISRQVPTTPRSRHMRREYHSRERYRSIDLVARATRGGVGKSEKPVQ